MRIEEYLTAYEGYRATVLAMERTFLKMAEDEGRMTASGVRFGNDSANTYTVGEIIKFADTDELRREYERRKRILTHATGKLQRAIARIRDVKLSVYLTLRYLYGMRNEDVAFRLNYCERQIYRLAKNAKTALKFQLLKEMPSARRGSKGRTYRLKKQRRGRTRLRKYAFIP